MRQNRFLATLIAATLVALPAIAQAGDNRFVGKWIVTGAVHAPWEDPDNPMLDAGEADFIGKAVEIGEDTMTGPAMLGCGKTDMKVDEFPYAGLFEGGLTTDPKDPAKVDEAKATGLATGLGFTAEPVPTLSTGCSEMLLHLRDANTILFGLNNRIFTMQRQ